MTLRQLNQTPSMHAKQEYFPQEAFDWYDEYAMDIDGAVLFLFSTCTLSVTDLTLSVNAGALNAKLCACRTSLL